MGKKTPPFKNYPKWTTARFFTFLRSAFRTAWNKYPPKYEALKQAEVGQMTNKKTGRPAKHYECSQCHKYFPAKEVQVDHLIDAGTLTKFEDVQGFVERLFCSVDELQVLCKPCHKNKTHIRDKIVDKQIKHRDETQQGSLFQHE